MGGSNLGVQRCIEIGNKRRAQATMLTIAGLLLLLLMLHKPDLLLVQGPRIVLLNAAALALLSLAAISMWIAWLVQRHRRLQYQEALVELQGAMSNDDLDTVTRAISNVSSKAGRNELVESLVKELKPDLDRHVQRLTKQRLRQELARQVAAERSQYKEQLAVVRQQIPLVAAEAALSGALVELQERRAYLECKWEDTYKTLSWWNKIKYFEGPDFSELDQVIQRLKTMHSTLSVKHANDLRNVDRYLSSLKVRAEARILAARNYVDEAIENADQIEPGKNLPLKAAFWCSVLSIPVSVGADVVQAGSIYDALRTVNGNYVDMSDAAIWSETLFLPDEQLIGLASLAKGAYFEQLVASDTSGMLFENFNNPGTDIVIHGQEFQLKATDSAGYINSVDLDIPVIATSEVAEITRALDSGFANADLSRSVDLALGGTVIDIGDTAVDALLAGVGGLGLFATLQGIGHAAERYNNGGDGVEALFGGVGVALEGTARAMVGTAELGYKVLSSAPSRFVGRVMLAGVRKLAGG